jgi:hypothetical protein
MDSTCNLANEGKLLACCREPPIQPTQFANTIALTAPICCRHGRSGSVPPPTLPQPLWSLAPSECSTVGQLEQRIRTQRGSQPQPRGRLPWPPGYTHPCTHLSPSQSQAPDTLALAPSQGAHAHTLQRTHTHKRAAPTLCHQRREESVSRRTIHAPWRTTTASVAHGSPSAPTRSLACDELVRSGR